MKTRCDRFWTLSLALVLGLGAFMAWWFVTLMTVQNSPWYRGGNEDLMVLTDGSPVIRTTYGYQSYVYRTLDGKQVEQNDNTIVGGAYFRGPTQREDDPFVGLSLDKRVTRLFHAEYNPMPWYRIHDGALHGHVYLVNYDIGSRRPVGYIGRHGFCAEEPPLEEQFLVDSRVFDTPSRDTDVHIVDPRQITDPGQTYLLTDDGLVSINLRDRSVKSLLADTAILSCARYFRDFILRMPDRMLAITRDGKEQESFPLPAELRNIGFTYFPTKEHVAVVLRKQRHVNDLFWIDHDGKITRQEHVALRGQSRLAEAENNLVSSITWLCPALPLGIGAYGCWEAYKYWKHEDHATSSDEPQGYFARLRESLEDYLVLLLIPSVVSVILAWIAYRRQRRYGLPWTPVWTAFVLLFGLPAYFGYLAHRVWPARLPCPHCGQLAPRDRPACIRCGQDFPQPALKGTEVFA